MTHTAPSELEMQVLSVLWNKAPLTARQVLEQIPDGKERAYTTILSVLQVMEKKGLVTHKNKGKTHLFSPKVQKNKILGGLFKRVINHYFDGSKTAAFQMLLDKKTSQEELKQLKEMIAEAEKRNDA